MWEPIETAPSIGPGISWLPKDTGRETWSRDPVPLGCNRCLLAANNVDANTGRGGERAHWQPRDARRPAPGGFRSTVGKRVASENSVHLTRGDQRIRT